jgi:hypothetical protein
MAAGRFTVSETYHWPGVEQLAKTKPFETA